jgi:hypothetical protein
MTEPGMSVNGGASGIAREIDTAGGHLGSMEF